jgi:phenylacetic acid degradation operon negative regulatory protein
VTDRRSGRVVPLPAVDLRPQSVLLGFFGDFVSDPHTAVSASSVVDVLGGVGVGVHATRATLSRMVRRGLLRREAQGRQAYFGLTDFGLRTVIDGRRRTQETDIVDRGWDGRWTLVSFSLPEDSQRQRHDLRARLSWAGFGMVNAGLWAAPRHVDVVSLLDDLDVLDGVRAFTGEPAAPSGGAGLVRDLYDLDGIASGYDAFLRRWRPYDRAVDRVPDPLVARVVLAADWLLVVRHDPRLPVQFLPGDWPGYAALELQRRLVTELAGPSEREALRRLDLRRTSSARASVSRPRG